MINLNNSTDTTLRIIKPLWVSCKPYFSNKQSKADNGIKLTENWELV